MKKNFFILLQFLISAALVSPAFPQEAPDADALAPDATVQTTPLQAPAAAKKPAAKKKKKKKNTAQKPPVSEYKFRTTPQTPAYKFDKMSNPIIPKKAPLKKKKKSKAGAVKKAERPPEPEKAAPPLEKPQDLPEEAALETASGDAQEDQ